MKKMKVEYSKEVKSFDFPLFLMVLVIVSVVFLILFSQRINSYRASIALCGEKPYAYADPWFDFGEKGIGVQCEENSTKRVCKPLELDYKTYCLKKNEFGQCMKERQENRGICW